MPTGKVYIGDEFFRDLTDSQISFLQGGRWTTKKEGLDELIDTDFEKMEIKCIGLKE